MAASSSFFLLLLSSYILPPFLFLSLFLGNESMYATSNHVQSHPNHLPPNFNNNTNTNHSGVTPQRTHHQQQSLPREPTTIIGIPSVSIHNNQLVVGSSQSSSTRSYTPLKVLGDGTFGTVWLCDWHGTLPPDTPLSPMQCGAGARPEWAGKRLVAVKRMKKTWQGGWDECKRLKELESLRAIPFHPNIIPLYDFFLLPASKELYFVFESMEGNLYHLIKARKGRALAGGLVSSIFHQIVSGLHHVHQSGYFHRDMKPENVLVTTIGLHDYQPLTPYSTVQSDVVAIIKLADFGLARETKSKPPYTEYVSTRWYRAPEVLLLSRDYSNPVDMWALGTIMAELVNLRPLFPGSGQVDQVARICEILGDPSDEYGVDRYGKPLGGGKWSRGIKLAKALHFAFPKIQPKDFYALFDRTVPLSLVQCIIDLLRYDPNLRLTSAQCLEHPYLVETLPYANIPYPAGHQPNNLRIKTSVSAPPASLASLSPRDVPPSHSHSAHIANGSSHRNMFYPNGNGTATYANGLAAPSQTWSNDSPNGDYVMDVSPRAEHVSEDQAMDVHQPVPEYHPKPALRQEADPAPSHGTKLKLFGKKHSKWGLGMFGSHSDKQQLPVVEEVPAAASSSNHSLHSNDGAHELPMSRDPVKVNRQEAERLRREADIQRRRMAEHSHREQARAVMKKRQQQLFQSSANDLEWKGGANGYTPPVDMPVKGKQASTGPIRQLHGPNSLSTVNAASGLFNDNSIPDWRRETERLAKRRRELADDDHSMSSSEVQSIGEISFATVDSDPGPPRLRHRSSAYAISRMTSTSSLRAFDEYSVRSSNSFSVENQLASEFRIRANVDSLPESMSPPPMQTLSLSSSPSLAPSSPWASQSISPTEESLYSRRSQQLPFISVSPTQPQNYEFGANGAPRPAVNPIFKVPPLPDNHNPMQMQLPPFSQLAALAEGGEEYPPLSPMSFRTPDDDF